eukprot:scaffold32031_cov63-Cyclotella_meneghiniana.AAC.3
MAGKQTSMNTIVSPYTIALLPYIGPIVGLIISSATLGYARSTYTLYQKPRPFLRFCQIQVPISRQLPLYPQTCSKRAAATGYHTVSISFDIAAILRTSSKSFPIIIAALHLHLNTVKRLNVRCNQVRFVRRS